MSLVNAVNKALQKDPDKRFMHAGDFGAELRLIRLAARAHVRNGLSEDPEAAPRCSCGAARSPAAARAGPGRRHRRRTIRPRRARRSPTRGVRARPRAGAGTSSPPGLRVAAVAVAAVLGTIVFMQRTQRPDRAAPRLPPATAPGACGRRAANPAVSAVAPTGMVKLVTEPDGAAVIDQRERDGAVTPADIAVADLTGAKVQRLEEGFKAARCVRASRAAASQMRTSVAREAARPPRRRSIAVDRDAAAIRSRCWTARA